MDESAVSVQQQDDKPMATQTWGEWASANKMMILAAIVIALGLLYWFYFRGAAAASVADAVTESSPSMDGQQLNITRMRGGGLY